METDGDREHAYGDLPPKDTKDGYFAKLKNAFYDMRDAARGWDEEHTMEMRTPGAPRSSTPRPSSSTRRATSGASSTETTSPSPGGGGGGRIWSGQPGRREGGTRLRSEAPCGQRGETRREGDSQPEGVVEGRGLQIKADPRHAEEIVKGMGCPSDRKGSARREETCEARTATRGTWALQMTSDAVGSPRGPTMPEKIELTCSCSQRRLSHRWAARETETLCSSRDREVLGPCAGVLHRMHRRGHRQ